MKLYLNEQNTTVYPVGTEVTIQGWGKKDIPYVTPINLELRNLARNDIADYMELSPVAPQIGEVYVLNSSGAKVVIQGTGKEIQVRYYDSTELFTVTTSELSLYDEWRNN